MIVLLHWSVWPRAPPQFDLLYNGEMPSLAHAYIKIQWARKQLKELEALCAKRGRFILKTKRLYYERRLNKLPKHSRCLLTVKPGATRMPYLAQILTGQIVTGLRGALDYLVGNLAELDSGPASRRTQFPVESSVKRFVGRQATFLEGLNSAHIAAIEKLQPYNACNWTGPMAALSNLDKHNALIPTKMDFIYSGILDPVKRTVRNPLGYKVRMYIEPTVFITNGKPIELIKTLREIATRVTETIDSFNPEF